MALLPGFAGLANGGLGVPQEGSKGDVAKTQKQAGRVFACSPMEVLEALMSLRLLGVGTAWSAAKDEGQIKVLGAKARLRDCVIQGLAGFTDPWDMVAALSGSRVVQQDPSPGKRVAFPPNQARRVRL